MKLHHKIAKIFGYDCIKIKKNHLTLESHLANILSGSGIDLVLDVGGNEGQFGSMLREIGYSGRIISFEPVSHVYEQLKVVAADDVNWDVVNIALGAENEEMEINVTASSDFSSFMSASDYGAEKYSGSAAVLRKEKVAVRKLDDVISDYVPDLDAVKTHLKLDAQGFEPSVVKGGTTVLSHALTLQAEMAVQKIYQDMPDYMQSLQLYRDKGFEVTGMYPVSRDRETQILIEFDCVMKKIGRKD